MVVVMVGMTVEVIAVFSILLYIVQCFVCILVHILIGIRRCGETQTDGDGGKLQNIVIVFLAAERADNSLDDGAGFFFIYLLHIVQELIATDAGDDGIVTVGLKHFGKSS